MWFKSWQEAHLHLNCNTYINARWLYRNVYLIPVYRNTFLLLYLLQRGNCICSLGFYGDHISNIQCTAVIICLITSGAPLKGFVLKHEMACKYLLSPLSHIVPSLFTLDALKEINLPTGTGIFCWDSLIVRTIFSLLLQYTFLPPS